MIGSVLFGAVAGGYAGRWGRVLLRSLPRPVILPVGVCEFAVGLLWSLVALRAHIHDVSWWWVALLLAMAWWGVLLSVCDVVAYRLPDRLTLPAYPVGAVAVFITAAALERAAIIGGALAGGAVYAGIYVIVRLLSPHSLGPGDVKLAGSLGACSGAVSPWGTAVCMALTSMLTLLTVTWLMVFRRRQGVAHGIPHGPAMLVPVWGLLMLA